MEPFGTAPIGSILAWAGPLATLPAGWKECNGEALDRTRPENEALFDVIGTTWGGDGVSLFRIPDLRGMFLRGVSGGSGRDPDAAARTSPQPEDTNPGNTGNNVGSHQSDAFQGHRHGVSLGRDSISGSNGTRDCEEGSDKFNSDPGLGSLSVRVEGPVEGGAGEPRTASETRPRNAFVHWIIRHQ